ncbi:atherin-like [Ochotona princeps]|uniref:atherin-like n=1 Tax=Ochotona princeps TaxID=9978 RepID=UPI0027155F1C|nr:atherin-like [Ochotona princeps]
MAARRGPTAAGRGARAADAGRGTRAGQRPPGPSGRRTQRRPPRGAPLGAETAGGRAARLRRPASATVTPPRPGEATPLRYPPPRPRPNRPPPRPSGGGHAPGWLRAHSAGERRARASGLQRDSTPAGGHAPRGCRACAAGPIRDIPRAGTSGCWLPPVVVRFVVELSPDCPTL